MIILGQCIYTKLWGLMNYCLGSKKNIRATYMNIIYI